MVYVYFISTDLIKLTCAKSDASVCTNRFRSVCDPPQLIAGSVYVAIFSIPAKLRWHLAESEPAIIEARFTVVDALLLSAWRNYLIVGLEMSDWLIPTNKENKK